MLIFYLIFNNPILSESVTQTFSKKISFLSSQEKHLYLLQKKAQIEHVRSNYSKSLKYYYDLAEKSREYNKDKYLKESYFGIATLSIVLKDYMNALFFDNLIISLSKDGEYMGLKASLHKVQILLLIGRKKQALSLYKSILFFYKKSHLSLFKKHFLLFDHTEKSLSKVQKKDPEPPTLQYTIQCGAFSNKKNALKMIHKLKKIGCHATIHPHKNIFSILITTSNLTEQNKTLTQLKQASIDHFVLKNKHK